MTHICQKAIFKHTLGNEAEQNMDFVPPPAIAVNPLRRGIIANYTLSAKMFRFYLQKALGNDSGIVKRLLAAFLPRPKIAVCVPEPLTEVEEKAFSDVFYQAGAKEVAITELSFDQAIASMSDSYPVIVGIIWNG